MKGDDKEREALDMESSSVQKGPEQWFLDAHPEWGTLRVQVSTGRGLFPVEGAQVEIYRYFGPERTVFYEGATDSSGIVEGIRLPALPAGWSQSSETAGISGTAYQASVRHPQYGTVDARQVAVFPQIETILAVSLESA